jgi:hypothetical protein
MIKLSSTLTALGFLLCSGEALAQTSQPTVSAGLTIPEPASTGGDRPSGVTFGLGSGFATPQNQFAPNVVSARLRFASGFTLEPIIIGSFDQQKDSVQAAGVVVDVDTNTTDVTFAVGVRYPLASRGPVDFLGLVVPAVNFNKVVVDPDGDDNNDITSSRAVLVDWGIGLEWFIRPNFSTSFNALNPLLIVTALENEDENNDVITDTNDILVGAIFDPIVQVLFHLYF